MKMAFLLFLLVSFCFAQDDGPLVDTNYGTLRGASMVYEDGRFKKNKYVVNYDC